MARWLTCLACASVLACSGPPRGQSGSPADALARTMIQSVDGQAWDTTGRLAWTFAGRHAHLWDKQRHWAQVVWGDVRAQIGINEHFGRVWEDGVEVTGKARDELLASAHAKWINDAFWLNPVVKAFDPGTEREVITQDGRTGLLVRYTSGGNTPGDQYLWWLDEHGRPDRWQMWVSIIPIKGAEATWEGWLRLDTGAWVSTLHDTALFTLRLTDVRGAATLAALEPGDDPFAPLQACVGSPGACGQF